MIAELTFLIVAVALALPDLVVRAFEVSGHPRRPAVPGLPAPTRHRDRTTTKRAERYRPLETGQ